jgi:microsomal dipeptidase-like Zn-dependent dipeptidase
MSEETKLSLRTLLGAVAQSMLFSFSDLKHIAFRRCVIAISFYALVDRNSCFAAVDNRLRNIISGKWRLVYVGGIKNVGFHHDFGMISSPNAAAQVLLRHFERPNCQFLAELAGGLSH